MAQEIHQDGAVAIASARLAARVKPRGAELCSLRDGAGREFLWQAGPAWPRHAPLLFPIVGRLRDDMLRLDGNSHALGQHGFARDQAFALAEQDAGHARFVLRDSAATRAAYPFAFALGVSFAAHDATLTVTHEVTNTGEVPLPFSIGAHPAFAWPLPGAARKQGHMLHFEQVESGAVHRPGPDGLLRDSGRTLPLAGRDMALEEGMFADGAFVLLDPASRRLRFAAPGAPGLEVAWQGFAQLGIWMKPGGDFLCIEPWAGHADLAGWEGDFRARPGVQLLEPGGTRRFLHRITLLG